MIEEQIDIEILVTNLEQDLSPDERKSGAEFQQKALNVINECLLNFALSSWIGGIQEVKQVRVLEEMCRHIRLCGRQSRFEVADRLPIAPMGATGARHTRLAVSGLRTYSPAFQRTRPVYSGLRRMARIAEPIQPLHRRTFLFHVEPADAKHGD